ncbi:MAG TPA: hypothetical protein VFR23_04145 [Jiangellaceae bacterium]|nr:hypothetical protein [Jiangellaceae bacterium]
MTRRKRDPFRRQVLGVLRKPPKCEHDEKLQTECEVCNAQWSVHEARRKKRRSGDG